MIPRSMREFRAQGPSSWSESSSVHAQKPARQANRKSLYNNQEIKIRLCRHLQVQINKFHKMQEEVFYQECQGLHSDLPRPCQQRRRLPKRIASGRWRWRSRRGWRGERIDPNRRVVQKPICRDPPLNRERTKLPRLEWPEKEVTASALATAWSDWLQVSNT